jgi:lipopolysaccharide export system protein LptC
MMQPAHHLRGDWLSRLQSLAPLVVAGSLAGFTWWLVASSPESEQASRSVADPAVPDYELAQARLARFDANGRIEAVLDGDRMRHYPSTQSLQVDAMQMAARHVDGRRLQAQAQQGEWQEGSGVVTLTGGADVRMLPAAPGASGAANEPAGTTRVRGEQLQLDTRARVVSSQQPVWLTRDRSEVRAQSLHHDEAAGLTDLGGRVVGRLQGQSRPLP